MPRKSGVLELAVLGLLHESPLHGYELRKRLNTLLGSFRALSYGSLYPALRDLQARGYLLEQPADDLDTPAAAGTMSRRSRVVYSLTADGKERLQELLAEGGPSSWEDDTFGVHFAFFGQTPAAVRLRILEGRRIRLEERQANVSTSLSRTRERLDS
ncbi:MAG: transcriptional regulator, PadR family protein, partial [Frankiales bacterium]|nr:transcriptional regulator, PadR family protein [Frankiales bacterium]